MNTALPQSEITPYVTSNLFFSSLHKLKWSINMDKNIIPIHLFIDQSWIPNNCHLRGLVPNFFCSRPFLKKVDPSNSRASKLWTRCFSLYWSNMICWRGYFSKKGFWFDPKRMLVLRISTHCDCKRLLNLFDDSIILKTNNILNSIRITYLSQRTLRKHTKLNYLKWK